MKPKRTYARFLLILLLLTIALTTLPLIGYCEGGTWQRVDLIEWDGSASVAANTNANYQFDVAYSTGSVDATFIYVGATDTSEKVNGVYKTNGASCNIKAGWSSPPDRIASGETVTLSLSVSSGTPDAKWPIANGHAQAQIVDIKDDGVTIGAEESVFLNAEDNYWFETSFNNQFQSFNETVSAQMPSGMYEGDFMGITVNAGMNGIMTKALYIYQWTPNPETAVTPPELGSDEQGNNAGFPALADEEAEQGLIAEEIDTQAEEQSGESGTGLSSEIIKGRKPITKVSEVVAGVGIAVAGAAAGAAGAASANIKGRREEDDAEETTYQMRIYKAFGNKIRVGGEPVFVYARIVETDSRGTEIERPDLTAQIEIFTDGGGLTVENVSLAGSYMGAGVSAISTSGSAQRDGVIHFKYTGPGGYFQNNVSFNLVGEPGIQLMSKYPETVYLLAGKQNTITAEIKAIDFLSDPAFRIASTTEGAPFTAEITYDTKGSPSMMLRNLSEKDHAPTHFYETYSIELIAENEKEFARIWVRAILCNEGLIAKFEKGKPEIKGFYDNKSNSIPPTRVSFRLGIWEESEESLTIITPEKIELTCSDQRRVFDNLGLEIKRDDDNRIQDTVVFIVQVEKPFPSDRYYMGTMRALCEANGQWFDWETEVTLLPDIQQYTQDIETEYERCKKIITTYMPEDWQARKLAELEKARVLFGVEDYKAYRQKMWYFAERLILEEHEDYLKHAYAADETIAYLNVAVYIGDGAFEIALMPLGGPLATLLIKEAKSVLLKVVDMWYQKGQIDYGALMQFIMMDLFGGLDDLTEMPKPNEKRKLAIWLAGFFIYRFAWHMVNAKDDNGKLVGITGSLELAGMDLKSKAVVSMLGNYIEAVAKNSSIAHKVKKIYNKDADKKLAKPLSDAAQGVLNETDEFIGAVAENELGKDISEGISTVVDETAKAILWLPSEFAEVMEMFISMVSMEL